MQHLEILLYKIKKCSWDKNVIYALDENYFGWNDQSPVCNLAPVHVRDSAQCSIQDGVVLW